MRDFSTDHRWLSLNTATVRKQGDLAEIIEACARHGIRAIDPWRDQVAAIGLDRAARAVRDAGLALAGYCRRGLFPAAPVPRGQVANLGGFSSSSSRPTTPCQERASSRLSGISTASIGGHTPSSPGTRGFAIWAL